MKYEYSKIEDYKNQMASVKIDMQKQIESIREIISQIGSNWTGAAADYYTKQARNYFSSADDFISELDACIAFLQKSSDNYDKLDKRLKDEINNIIMESKIFN